jgi:hypothetical protein
MQNHAPKLQLLMLSSAAAAESLITSCAACRSTLAACSTPSERQTQLHCLQHGPRLLPCGVPVLQLLETSGVADAEPLAASLAAAGFKLTGVAVLVDAEAGQAVLQQEVAVAQVGGLRSAGAEF